MADQMATPDAIGAAGAAPRSGNRQAVTMMIGSTRYSSPSRFWKTIYVTMPVAASKPASSAPRYFPPPVGEARVGANKLKSRGATRSTPMASPVHQTAQVDHKFAAGTEPEKISTEVPTVALIAMPPSGPFRI